jgi:beta-1,4-mannosyltransferase
MSYRVVSLPGLGTSNPYVDLFYRSLLPYGVNLVGALEFDYVWLKTNINEFDCIHLHWPENIWREYLGPLHKKIRFSNIKGAWRLSVKIETTFQPYFDNQKIKWFENCLDYLKGQGKKIIWTWHNIEPHENNGYIDVRGTHILAEKSDLIIFHSRWAEDQCRKMFAIPGKTIVMPHGNYDGIYPEPRNRAVVLTEIGLETDKPVVGCLGAMRGYKGIDVACEAVQLLGGSVQLLCAGMPHHLFETPKNISKVSNHNISFVTRKLSEQELSDFANACDCILLPYKKITGSGALLLALTLRKGVVASDLPYFREILRKVPNAGLLVSPNSPEALAKGIDDFLSIPLKVREEASKLLADMFSWNDVVVPVGKIFADHFQ